jgi:hypothetical protein
MKRRKLSCREKAILRSSGRLLPQEIERLNREIRAEMAGARGKGGSNGLRYRHGNDNEKPLPDVPEA